MKPVIRWYAEYDSWLCIDDNTRTFAGGSSPLEAYNNWKRAFAATEPKGE